MHIIFNPPVNEENKYIETMVRALHENGFKVYALDTFFSSKTHFQSIKLVHLNWFENVDDSSFRSAFRSFIRKMFVLSVIRISGKKLIWTMHNRASHEKGTGYFSRMITRCLIRWSHRIVIHSEKSRKIIEGQYPEAMEKLFYLPHPDFIGTYGPIPPPIEQVNPSSLKLLFLGAVKPYKNIELLIRAAGEYKENVSLTIAGKPNTSSYKQAIAQVADSAGNVQLMLEFIPDHALPGLMQSADLLVLPYDLDSSLNSGTVILAFSYRKTVISPEIGTIEDLKDAKEMTFHYNYGSEEEHLEQLKIQIAKAIELKNQDRHIFEKLGNKLFVHVNDVHGKELVGKKLVYLYQRLLE